MRMIYVRAPLLRRGLRKQSKVHVSYGYGLFTGGMGFHGGATKLGATVIPVSSGNTARQITIIKDFESDVICCTPSYAFVYCGDNGKRGRGCFPTQTQSGYFRAEPWTEEMRAEIERRLGIKSIRRIRPYRDLRPRRCV